MMNRPTDMNTSSTNRLDELLIARLSDQITTAEMAELQTLLRDDPEAMDRYLDLCELDAALASPSANPVAEPVGSIDTVLNASLTPNSLANSATSSRPSGRRFGFFIAAASILLVVAGLGTIRWMVQSPSATVASNHSVADQASVAAESVPTSPQASAQVDPKPAPEARTVSNRKPRNPWKTIQSTGSNKHPALTETAVPASRTDRVRPVKFNRDIRPIFSETCFHCHGPDEEGRRAGLRLDTAEGAREDLGGYQPIFPGDLGKSEAWQRIISDDTDLLMPPPESHLVLTEDQKQLVRRWIEEGAEYEGHWAFVPPTKPDVPDAIFEDDHGQRWGKNAIDAFVATRMTEAGLSPSKEANPRTLIRRLFLDLTGLPPSVEQVRAFVDDYETRGEAAWQDQITDLLDSPHFGERMAIPWLDQARYADTNGYSIDGGRDMWLWRDWVIHAYNENLPFDQFLVHQIAGDLLPDATDAHRIASGFNRNHMVTHEGGTIPEENLTNYAADRVKTTSEVFLGLTMGCAQCHDHKYDPISQKEYYQFFAFFNELSDKGLDGNGGKNPAPSIMATTVLPKDELPPLRSELKTLRQRWTETTDGFNEWLADARAREAARGKQFQLHHLKTLDVSSPNRPGEYTIEEDGSVLVKKPAGGLNAMSHALELPVNSQPNQTINGIRIRFFPYGDGKTKRLSPHKGVHAPRVTTVLVSAGELPAKQVDIYRQKSFSQATASSAAADRSPRHVLNETNQNWWRPAETDQEQHLTLTFDEPVDPDKTPYLSVMVFFGKRDSLPHHWKIEAFSGVDTDSVHPADVSRLIAMQPDQWNGAQREQVMEVFRRNAPSLHRMRIRMANLQERIDVLTEPHPTMVMDVAKKPRETFVLARGQYDAHGEKVSPETLAVLPKLRTQSSPTSSDDLSPPRASRLDLARWMIDPQHPLTARVAVNRIWALLFGNGIVSTSADFGSQGEWPSHPDLLDYLATTFVQNGWNQKELIRTIVSSATYRQDSFASEENRTMDPKNRLLARGPRYRLSAELVRDQALAVSGLLVPRIGGPSVHPYQPAGLWKEVSHFGSTPATKQVYVQDHGEKLYRRSLYTITKRTSPHPSMTAFDAPNREMCTVQRGVTNTPLQALVTLNDTQFVEAARVFAENLLRDEALADDTQRMERAFEQTTSRLPVRKETDLLLGLLDDERQRLRNAPDEATRTVRVGEWPVADELDPVQHAAWTQIASLLFNLSETLTRQ